jgi:hypothetical protein
MIDYKHKKRNCTSCGKIKSFNKFRWDYRRDIPKSVCIECVSDYNRKRYSPAKGRELYRKKKEKNENENLL